MRQPQPREEPAPRPAAGEDPTRPPGAMGRGPVRPNPLTTSPPRPTLRQTGGSDGRRPLQVVLVDRPDAPSRPLPTAPLGVSWWLWALLALAFLFLGFVQVYRTAERARWTARAAGDVTEEASSLAVSGPEAPTRADDLLLTWDPVDGAAGYRLQISTITGAIVIEGLEVEETSWYPPIEALPALPRGEYRWWIDAVDLDGHTLARSQPETFQIY